MTFSISDMQCTAIGKNCVTISEEIMNRRDRSIFELVQFQLWLSIASPNQCNFAIFNAMHEFVAGDSLGSALIHIQAGLPAPAHVVFRQSWLLPVFPLRRISALTIPFSESRFFANTSIYPRGLAERGRPERGSFEHWGESPDKHYLTA
jgi:hypothetical protein